MTGMQYTDFLGHTPTDDRFCTNRLEPSSDMADTAANKDEQAKTREKQGYNTQR